MRVLIACEFSWHGAPRFSRSGHDKLGRESVARLRMETGDTSKATYHSCWANNGGMIVGIDDCAPAMHALLRV